jgi:hypothetical protein
VIGRQNIEDENEATTDFGTQLRILIGGGERTRAIIYFLGLMSSALLVITVESDLFNFAEGRYRQVAEAFSCYTHNLNDKDSVPTLDGDTCKDHYDYVRQNYMINVPNDLKHYNYQETWDALAERYRLLTKEYVENASTTLPIIGIKIDKGNAFMFGMFVSIAVLGALKISIDNESVCLLNISNMLNSRNKVTAVISCYVFARPRAKSHIFWLFLFVPVLIISGDIIYNCYAIYAHHINISGGMNYIYYGIQVVSPIVLLWVTWVCFRAACNVDRQLFELNKRFLSEPG